MNGMPLLSIVVFLPLAGAIALAFFKSSRPEWIKGAGLGVSLLTLALVCWMLVRFDPGGGMQFGEQGVWIAPLGIGYHLGVDGLSTLMLLLTALMVPIALLASWKSIESRVKAFVMLVLALESGVMGVFCALDLILFYVFWEAMLIPLYFLVGVWGGPRGPFAALKFVLYTLAGSVLMLVAILALGGLGQGSFDLLALMQQPVDPQLQLWLFLGFAIAFAIKTPLFPLHSWMPDAYAQGPTASSILLSAVVSKAGIYGFLRFGATLFPAAFSLMAPVLMTLAVAGVVYGAWVAVAQQDVKRMIAYSSLSHVGLVMVGVFAFDVQSLTGAALQMFNHGVIVGGLFLLAGALERRLNSRQLDAAGGLMRSTPALAACLLVVALASLGLPGTSGFVGEFLILLGVFQEHWALGTIATSIVLLTAVYMLWMVQRTIYGQQPPLRSALADLQPSEWMALAPLLALIVWVGVSPQPLLNLIGGAIEALIRLPMAGAPMALGVLQQGWSAWGGGF